MMVWLFMAGGAPMFVVVAFGALGIGAAVRFAMVPSLPRLRFTLALAVAVLFAAVGAVCGDFVVVSKQVPEHPEWVTEHGLGMLVLMGVGESLAPAIFGCAIGAIMALISAVGLRRLGEASA